MLPTLGDQGTTNFSSLCLLFKNDKSAVMKELLIFQHYVCYYKMTNSLQLWQKYTVETEEYYKLFSRQCYIIMENLFLVGIPKDTIPKIQKIFT